MLYVLGLHQNWLSHDPLSFPIPCVCLNLSGFFKISFFCCTLIYFHDGIFLKKENFKESEFSGVIVIIVLILPVHGLHGSKLAKCHDEQEDLLHS